MGKNLQLIASDFEVVPLLTALARLPHLWTQIIARQTTLGTPHTDTETIFLRWAQSQSIEAVFEDIPAIDYPAFDNLPEARTIIQKFIDLLHIKELGRAIIVNLKPDGHIDSHIDEGSYADHYERFHICLESDFGNKYFVEDSPSFGEFAFMQPGELWWFNHKKKHWSYNGSEKSRLHLIIDAVVPSFRRERV